jgi:hypothetical protein
VPWPSLLAPVLKLFLLNPPLSKPFLLELQLLKLSLPELHPLKQGRLLKQR